VIGHAFTWGLVKFNFIIFLFRESKDSLDMETIIITHCLTKSKLNLF
jgi:hypothetical protein